MKIWHKYLLIAQLVAPVSIALWTGAHFSPHASGLEFFLGFLGTVTGVGSLVCAVFSAVVFVDEKGE